MRLPAVITSIAALLLAGAPAAAHGVRSGVAVGPVTVATFTHEDGSPLAHTPFMVLAPGSTGPYVSGTTDSRGRVAFLPDEPGAWTVRVAGADGHGTVITISVDSTALDLIESKQAVSHAHEHGPAEVVAEGHDHAAGNDPHPAAASRWLDAAAGLAVLSAALAVAVLLARRRRGRPGPG